MRSLRRTLVLVLTLSPAFVLAADEFKPLVQGDDPNQFTLVKIDAKTLTIKDGEVRVSGRPDGYFATKTSHENYVLKFDWMYERPEGYQDGAKFDGNSGLLIHIQGEHKVWPKCVEVQLANSDAGNIFAIFGAKFTGMKDAAAQKKAIKPVGQWNEEEVICDGDKITCKINGIVVASGTGSDPSEGPIGWQSEGSPIRFRNIKIKSLD